MQAREPVTSLVSCLQSIVVMQLFCKQQSGVRSTVGAFWQITIMETDWLYNPERQEFKAKVLALLLRRFGRDDIPTNNKAIYNCAHDWVSQGHKTTDGLVAYYNTYYI